MNSLLDRLTSRIWLGFVAIIVYAFVHGDTELMKWAFGIAAGAEGFRDAATALGRKADPA